MLELSNNTMAAKRERQASGSSSDDNSKWAANKQKCECHYDILALKKSCVSGGGGSGATFIKDRVRLKHRALVKKAHPDKHPDDFANANRTTVLLNLAKDVLLNDTLASGDGGRAPSTPGNTDDESNKAISCIRDMRDTPMTGKDDDNDTENAQPRPPRTRREFLVAHKINGFEEWLPEDALDGCVDPLNAFLALKGRSPTKLVYRDGLERGCGSSNSNAPGTNRRNCASPGKIVEMVDKYGKRDEYLAAEEMKPGDSLASDRDVIYVLRVHAHCFVLLWLHKLRLVLVCDGEDAFYKEDAFRQAVMARLSGARLVRHLHFGDQHEQDHCASSAVAIAIEFGRCHKTGELPTGHTLWCNRSALAKVRRVLHREPGMVRLKPAQAVQNRLTRARHACDKCGWKSAKTAIRTEMHLHKCTTKE